MSHPNCTTYMIKADYIQLIIYLEKIKTSMIKTGYIRHIEYIRETKYYCYLTRHFLLILLYIYMSTPIYYMGVIRPNLILMYVA